MVCDRIRFSFVSLNSTELFFFGSLHTYWQLKTDQITLNIAWAVEYFDVCEWD